MTGLQPSDFATLLFYVCMGFMATHELDAIQRREWRLLFLGAPLDDETAFHLFTVLHVPLFAWIMWAAPSPTFQTGFSLFAVIHAGVHWVVRRHPRNELNNPFSWFLIGGAALCGAAYLWMVTF